MFNPSREHLFALLSHELMHGVMTEEIGFVKLVKNNEIAGPDDPNLFDVDFRIEVNGTVVGYLDIEEKPTWIAGDWKSKFKRINVARCPKKQWEEDRIDGRETNKLRRFREMPEGSFWVGVRADYKAAMVVPARAVLSGKKIDQVTRYRKRPLPVYAINNSEGTFVDTPEAFRDFIIKEVIAHVAGRSEAA